MIFHSRSSEETFAIGVQLARRLAGGEVLVLSGQLGSGKTCLAQGIGEGLQVQEPLVSPTFPILLHYQGRLPLVHMDLYRLSGVEEFILLDGEALLCDQLTVCVIEWGERIASLLPASALRISIDCCDQGRIIRVLGWEDDEDCGL